MPEPAEVTKGFPGEFPLFPPHRAECLTPSWHVLTFSPTQQLTAALLSHFSILPEKQGQFFLSCLGYSGLLFLTPTPAVPQHCCPSFPWVAARACNAFCRQIRARCHPRARFQRCRQPGPGQAGCLQETESLLTQKINKHANYSLK